MLDGEFRVVLLGAAYKMGRECGEVVVFWWNCFFVFISQASKRFGGRMSRLS